MTIKHLVISGGAYKGFYTLGALNHLSSIKFYDIHNIENIYGSSIGGVIGLLLCLKLNWNDIIEHAINRPWQNLFHFSSENILNIFSKKGLLCKDLMYSIFDNFFKNAGLNRDATMKDIFDYSKITLYLFTVNITSFALEQISHKTHPDMKIIDAIYMSSSIPFLFQPLFTNGCYYIDGAIINPYPLNICLKDCENRDEILAFKVVDDAFQASNEQSSIFHFGSYIFYRLIRENYNNTNEVICNEIMIPSTTLNITDAQKIMNDSNIRKSMIKDGEKYAKLFLQYKDKHEKQTK